MIKKAILFLVIPASLFSLTDSEIINQCAIDLKKDRALISSLRELNTKQLDAIQKFLDSEIKSEMYYKDNIFIVNQNGEFSVYQVEDSKDYPVKEKQKFKYDKTLTYKFSGESSPRPYPYVPGIFKLGGGVFYDSVDKSVYPDMLLMFELLSFDKLFGIYGISLNVSGGLRHIGGSIGYQLYRTTFFKNTSIVFGYSHDFTKGFQTPYIGITLNF